MMTVAIKCCSKRNRERKLVFDISQVQGSRRKCKLFAQVQKKCLDNILILVYFKGNLVS